MFLKIITKSACHLKRHASPPQDHHFCILHGGHLMSDFNGQFLSHTPFLWKFLFGFTKSSDYFVPEM